MPSFDSRFALPPEDIDDLRPPDSSSKKGKGRASLGAEIESKTSKKRKRASASSKDKAEDEEMDLYDQVLNGPLPSTSTAPSKQAGEEQDDGAEEGEDDDEALNNAPKPLNPEELQQYNKKVDKSGVIYLSRIPPGMGPSKVKHILSHYGDVGRIYLVAADANGTAHAYASSKRAEKKKHRPHRFVEGWVEFSDKKVARHTAEVLNARPIGEVAVSKGSKRNGGTKKWKDDVWTMKYLPRFKWNDLSEQVAIEAATRAALLRTQLAQSKKEQAEYLRQVERANNYEKAQEKKRARMERKGESTTAAEASEQQKPRKERRFEQKAVISKKDEGVDEKLGRVLDSLF